MKGVHPLLFSFSILHPEDEPDVIQTGWGLHCVDTAHENQEQETVSYKQAEE
jgi:hypothetical protein